MPAQTYEGAILAAGEGSRMGLFGSDVPKPLAPVCNKTLIAYQLEAMRDLGMSDVHILVGRRGGQIEQAIGDGSKYGLRVRYAEQQERTGLARAVGELESCVNAPFVLMLGDIFFESSKLDEILLEFENSGGAAAIAVKHETDAEALKKNFSVKINDDGNVIEVVEKPRDTTETLKGCGIYVFDTAIFEAIRITPRSPLREEHELTDSLQVLIDGGHVVRAAAVVDWDVNLTYVDDLIECNVHQLRRLNKSSLVGADCTLDDSVELVDSVVGDRVTISGPARLERCVVTSDTSLSTTGDQREWNNAVITPAGVLQRKSGA